MAACERYLPPNLRRPRAVRRARQPCSHGDLRRSSTAMVLLSFGLGPLAESPDPNPAIPRSQIVVSIRSPEPLRSGRDRVALEGAGGRAGSRAGPMGGRSLTRARWQRHRAHESGAPSEWGRHLARWRAKAPAPRSQRQSGGGRIYAALDNKSRSPVRISFNVQETVHGRIIASVTESDSSSTSLPWWRAPQRVCDSGLAWSPCA